MTTTTKLEQLQKYTKELESLLSKYQHGWPPGHFYSPIPSLEQVEADDRQIFNTHEDPIPGVSLNEPYQLQLIKKFGQFYPDIPFVSTQSEGHLFFYDNPNYSYGEAIVLYCMMRAFNPKRVIEIGSGYSSCAILDINAQAFGGSIHCTFIDSDITLLKDLVPKSTIQTLDIIPQRLQEVPYRVFETLKANDILFIDSSHVVKIGSDVNYLLFQVLPRLKSRVLVHFHDIFYPFEYPKNWIQQGRYWNEAYLLRAFLQYNRAFKVEFFNDFIGRYRKSKIEELMPLFARNPGTSLWLRKAAAGSNTDDQS